MRKFDELTKYEQEELIADAKGALASKGVQYVFDELKEEYYQLLIQAEVGGLTASTAHASMKVLEDVRSRLQSIVNNDLMRVNQGRRR